MEDQPKDKPFNVEELLAVAASAVQEPGLSRELGQWLSAAAREILKLKGDQRALELIDDRKRGLYQRYTVKRVDGSSLPLGRHHHCHYFVIDLNHDIYAGPALEAYADRCIDQYPLLAKDLYELVKIYEDGGGPSGYSDAIVAQIFDRNRPL